MASALVEPARSACVANGPGSGSDWTEFPHRWSEEAAEARNAPPTLVVGQERVGANAAACPRATPTRPRHEEYP
jgi:hypothetical protein